MNSLQMFDGEISYRLTLTLCHFLWQGSLLGLITMLLGWLLRSRSASTRYAANLTALLLMVSCFPLTWALLPARGHLSAFGNPSHQIMGEAPAHHRSSYGPVLSSGTQADDNFDLSAGQANGSKDLARAAREGANIPSRRPVPASLSLLATVAPYSASAYFFGVLVMLLRLGCAVGRSHRLQRKSTPAVDQRILRLIHRQVHVLGIRTAPTVAWCNHISVPVVVGVIRPMILLPAAMATGMAPHVLESLLLHELAHIRRLDPWVNMLQRFCEALFFFHPAVWYVSGAISKERENRCDDIVLASGVSRCDYADALVRIAELCCTSRNLPKLDSIAILSAAGKPSQFKQRVLRVLDPTIPQTTQLTPSALLSMLLLIAAAVFAQTVPLSAGHAQNEAERTYGSDGARAIREGEDAEEQGLGQDDTLKESILAAAQSGAAFLKTQQLADGSWRFSTREAFNLGATALATLALLESGNDTEDPHVARALRKIAVEESDYNYDIALQVVVLCHADPDEYRQRIQKNVETLIRAQLRQGRSGMWHYGPEKAGLGDLSNSSFALWALDAAAEAGFAVDDEVWKRSYESLHNAQDADGGWGYIDGSESTGSMTGSGIVGIAICADRLTQARREGLSSSKASLEKAWEWLSANFSISHNPGSRTWHLYYLHVLRRAAQRTGRTTIGTQDWYQSGCRLLVEQQHSDGRWSGTHVESNAVLATSLALLFLGASDETTEPANGDRQSRHQTQGEGAVADGGQEIQAAEVPDIESEDNPADHSELFSSGYSIYATLAKRVSVQRELQLSDAQKKAIDEAQGLTAAGKYRQPKNRIWNILDQEQRRRLMELERQYVEKVAPWLVFHLREDIVELLSLSDEQTERLRSLLAAEHRAQIATDKEFQQRAKQGEDFLSLMRNYRYLELARPTMVWQRIMSVFTPEQRKRWDSLRGEPFDVYGLIPRL